MHDRSCVNSQRERERQEKIFSIGSLFIDQNRDIATSLNKVGREKHGTLGCPNICTYRIRAPIL